MARPLRLDTDPYLLRYADRVRGMRASEIRALFAVVSRPEIVSFAGGAPFTAALDFQAVEEVAVDIIRNHGPEALQYGGGQGREQLREQLVGVMAHEGVPAHVDDLVITIGGQQALELVAACFINRGDVVVAEGPTYVGALGAFSRQEADVRHVPMDHDGMRVDLLEGVLAGLHREGRTVKFVYTIPNHQNPAGVSLSPQRRTHLAELAVEHDLLILEDNPYGLLDFTGRTWPSLREMIPDRVIYVGTVSKTFAPGARVGWVAAPAPVREKIILLSEAEILCPPNLSQMIVESWLASQPWQDQVKRFREVYAERAEAMLAGLAAEMPDGVTWTTPVGGFYVWLTVPDGIDTGDLLAKAIKHRVAYVPGRGFYADGSGNNQMRLCYSFPPVERIREGVTRLSELLHEEVELVRAVLGDTQSIPRNDRPETGYAGHGG